MKNFLCWVQSNGFASLEKLIDKGLLFLWEVGDFDLLLRVVGDSHKEGVQASLAPRLEDQPVVVEALGSQVEVLKRALVRLTRLFSQLIHNVDHGDDGELGEYVLSCIQKLYMLSNSI